MNERVIAALLQRGKADWLDLSEVAWVVASMEPPPSDVVLGTLDVLRYLFTEGLMEPGDVSDGGFFAWDMPSDEALRRIEQQWRRIERLPQLGEICWIAITPVGSNWAMPAE